MALEASDRKSAPAQKSKVILLVEDEDSVRGVVRDMLQHYGFNVLEAAGGEQALEICTKNANVIDAVIADIAMPGMSGMELATRAEGLIPKRKWLFMSGYCEEALWRDYGVLAAEIPFIQKPFKPDKLIERIRTIVELQTSAAPEPTKRSAGRGKESSHAAPTAGTRAGAH